VTNRSVLFLIKEFTILYRNEKKFELSELPVQYSIKLIKKDNRDLIRYNLVPDLLESDEKIRVVEEL